MPGYGKLENPESQRVVRPFVYGLWNRSDIKKIFIPRGSEGRMTNPQREKCGLPSRHTNCSLCSQESRT
jgi:hypothetical protein